MPLIWLRSGKPNNANVGFVGSKPKYMANLWVCYPPIAIKGFTPFSACSKSFAKKQDIGYYGLTKSSERMDIARISIVGISVCHD
jgi:hypothetical protein